MSPGFVPTKTYFRRLAGSGRWGVGGGDIELLFQRKHVSGYCWSHGWSLCDALNGIQSEKTIRVS